MSVLAGQSTRQRRTVLSQDVGQRRHRPDYVLLILSALLVVVGLVVVFSISPALAAQKHVDDNYFISKQLIAVGLGVISLFAVSSVPPRSWRKLEMPLLISAALASIAVRLVGEEVNGAYRWLQIGGLSFQAAELIKLALIIWLAGFLTERKRRGVLNDWNQTFKPLLICLAIIGAVVVVLQSDLGSGGVMIAIMGAMAFVAGLPMKRVMMAMGVIGLGLVLAVATSPYRRGRVETFLNPASDCQGSGYQACQSLVSIGSGGIFGLGLGRSVQAYGYQPEAGNDSIFAIYAEKFGFIGTAALIGLFMALFSRIMRVLERAPDDYSRLVIVGILAWLSTQAIINIGAMIGLLPLKGITLPFISYGGTSLIFVTAAIGMVFNISRYTTYEVNAKSGEGGYDEDTSSGRRERRPHYATVSRRP
jgi:cell division protein FtsW